MGPPAAVAAVRAAVRTSLRDLAGLRQSPTVLVAVSGGPDSLGLLAAACFVGPRMGVRVGATTVDHGLQAGSTERAREVAALAASLDATPVSIWHVTVAGAGGPEAAARRARYDALAGAAAASRACAVLLGHTRDDQAETVLLGLARGSGARSLGGMPPRTDLYRRPLLALPRSTVAAAARAVPTRRNRGLPWDDPHNHDPAFARARVRDRVLPVLEQELGPGVAAALARTADLLRADADALDAWADGEATVVRDGDVDAVGLSSLPAAIRTRLLRRAAMAAGAPPSDLTAGHVLALDALVMRGSDGLTVDLPGRVRARRTGGRLRLARE